MPVSGGLLSSTLNPLSLLTRKQRGKKKGKKKSLVSSAAADFFPDSLLASCGALTPSGCVHAANPSPLPAIDPSEARASAPSPTRPGGGANKPLWLVSAGRRRSSMWESLRFALRTPVAALSSVAPKLPPPPPAVSAREGAPSVWKPFLLHSSLPVVQVLSLFFVSVFSFFFGPTQVLGEFLAFWEV